MTEFEQLKKLVDAGIEGKNEGIPMGFPRLENHISIRAATYYLIGGYTGSGKTSLVDDAFVLNPLKYILSQKDGLIDMHIIYFSMERPKSYKLAKWIGREIFLSQGVIMPPDKIIGWVRKDKRMTFSSQEYQYFLMCEDFIDALMTKVDIVSGPQNPTGIRKYVDAYMNDNGILNTDDKYKHIYTPYNPNVIVEVISDTIGLTKGEKDHPKGKQAIDKSSEDKQRMRDVYGYTPIDVSQFNRDIANPTRLKNGDVEPMLEDFKDTGNTQENADVVMSLFDPYRYKVEDPSRYDLSKMRDSEGRKKYRNLKILKNSYGSDDIRIGLAFQPEIGLFREMRKLEHMNSDVYDSIIDNTYFLKEN